MASSQSTPSWQSIIKKYNRPEMKISIWQIISTLGAYLILWALMVQVISYSYWLAIPLIFLASGFLIRIFIIFHDCGHGSFFRSKKLNVIVGKTLGMLVYTPYHYWTDCHRQHHQTVGNLDKRGLGDVWTLTVDEYLELSTIKRFNYRVFRHPISLFIIGGPLLFVFGNRFTTKKMTRKQKLNIYFTNIVILVLVILVSWWIGWQAFLLIQVPVIYFAAMGGVYLFYLQHQYEDVIWSREEEWDYEQVALHGSSFFRLPGVLRYFTGNIGYHHIHHLGSTIPNYHLKKCHNENKMFQEVKPITFFKSFHSLKLRLWDEKQQKIVSFRDLRMSSA